MSIKLVSALTAFVAMVGIVGILQTHRTNATVQVVEKVNICHADSNAKQPYGPKKIEVSVSSIFTTNGHDSHVGPVFDGTNQSSWGDIIPPFWYMTKGRFPVLAHYDGKNWTTAGQAIWNNNCQFASESESEGNASYTLACEKITLMAPTGVKPNDAEYQYYVDGVATALGAKTVTAGDHTITLKVDGELTDTKVVHVTACEEEGSPNLSAALVCDEKTSTFTLTVSNSGNGSGSVVLNGGSATTVPAGGSVPFTIKDNGSGVAISLTSDGKAIGEFNGRLFFCKQGQGSIGGGPVTVLGSGGGGQGAATGVTSLPLTAGDPTGYASIIAGIVSALGIVGSLVWRLRSATSL